MVVVVPTSKQLLKQVLPIAMPVTQMSHKTANAVEAIQAPKATCYFLIYLHDIFVPMCNNNKNQDKLRSLCSDSFICFNANIMVLNLKLSTFWNLFSPLCNVDSCIVCWFA